MTNPHNPTVELKPEVTEIDDMPGFYLRWRRRVHAWITQNTREELADAVLFLPDLLALVIRLIRDPRTPLVFRGQLLLVAIYVLSPIDIIPEALFGAAGLADDALITSVMFARLMQQASGIDPQILRDNWSGSGDVIETLHELVDSGGELMNTRIWQRVRGLFGKSAPDPAVVDAQRSERKPY